MFTDVARSIRSLNRISRLGFHFLFVAAFAMLGGSLRGFNLLLILAGLLVGALIVQWRVSKRSIRSIQATRRAPERVVAAEPFRVVYRLLNGDRFLASRMLRIEDAIESRNGADRSRLTQGVEVVRPRESVSRDVECTIFHRGRYRLGPIDVTTSFPLSLFLSRKTFGSEHELWVLPQMFVLPGNWQQHLRRVGVLAGSSRAGGRGTDGEFFGLRQWRTGDSPKWIHWRTSARLQELAVRQFEPQRRFDWCVVVDGYLKPGTNDQPAETAISLAATLIAHVTQIGSGRVLLAAAGSENEVLASDQVGGDHNHMLQRLADLRLTDSPSVAGAIDQAFAEGRQTNDLIVISPRSSADATAADPQLDALLASWQRRGALRWMDVRDSRDTHWIGGIDRSIATSASQSDRTTSSAAVEKPAEVGLG